MSSPPPTSDHSPHATSKNSGRTAQLSAEPQPRLFAYGTLQFPEVLDALLERKPTITPGTASGWRAVMLRNRLYPALVRDDGAMFEDDALRLSLDGLTGNDGEAVIQKLLQQALAFGNDKPIPDDVSLVAVTRT